MRDEFMFKLSGLIKGEFIQVESDSAIAIVEIVKIMDKVDNFVKDKKAEVKSK